MQHQCTICRSADLVPSVTRSALPVMQSILYHSKVSAERAPSGQLTLVTCQQCGHTFNCDFDPSLMVYDKSYDNSVPSKVMDRYFDDLSDYLYHKYHLSNGFVVDVGCGKGHFLKKLIANHSDVGALGIDPSYEGPLAFPENQLRFIPDIFRQKYLDSSPSLLSCRLMIEHIHDMPGFLRGIHSALRSRLPVPFFFEVRNLDWMVDHRAFADFCFEHFNYFTSDSIRESFRLNGFIVDNITPSYGGQNLWIEGLISPDEPATQLRQNPNIVSTTHRLQTYFSEEQNHFNRIRSFLQEKKNEQRHIVVWGLATKGTLFNYLIDPDSTLIDQCVDVNEDKFGKFLPITGRLVQSPREIASRSLRPLIIVMNPNYKTEIIDICKNYSLVADVYDMDQI